MSVPAQSPRDLSHRAANRLRIRWAAIGAAIGITFGAGTIATVNATQTSGERLTYVATEPCRLIDTRPAFNVGPRNTPLGPVDTITVDARGAQGDCTTTQLPANAQALALNITALDATADSFFTVWATGARPLAASLNPAPGQPPIPNAVTTELSPTGTFNLYNENGAVNAVIDVVGHFVDHNHDDRYYTRAEVDARLDALEAAQPFVETERDDNETVIGADEVVVFVDVTAPVAGQVTLHSTTSAQPVAQARCSITTGTVVDGSHTQAYLAGDPNDFSQLAGTRTYDIAAGVTARYNLVCGAVGSSSSFFDSILTAVFTPAP